LIEVGTSQNGGDETHGQTARSEEKHREVGQNDAEENGGVEVPFIGLERRGSGRSEELDSGR
jgi:hypothetical protein